MMMGASSQNFDLAFLREGQGILTCVWVGDGYKIKWCCLKKQHVCHQHNFIYYYYSFFCMYASLENQHLKFSQKRFYGISIYKLVALRYKLRAASTSSRVSLLTSCNMCISSSSSLFLLAFHPKLVKVSCYDPQLQMYRPHSNCSQFISVSTSVNSV